MGGGEGDLPLHHAAFFVPRANMSEAVGNVAVVALPCMAPNTTPLPVSGGLLHSVVVRYVLAACCRLLASHIRLIWVGSCVKSGWVGQMVVVVVVVALRVGCFVRGCDKD